MISHAGEMYFILGSIIGGSPSNSTKEDTKDCSSRRDETYLIFKSSNHGAVHCASVENNCICVHHRAILYCKRMLLINYVIIYQSFNTHRTYYRSMLPI